MNRLGRVLAANAVLLTAGLMLRAATVAAQTPLLEVERGDATKVLQVYDDAGLVVGGSSGAGAIPAKGAGVRLMWYPGKAAFRAGQADGTEWDDANVGEGSVAFGRSNIVRGSNSLAIGFGNSVPGNGNSIATGNNSKASGGNSVAMGNQVTASGFFAVALGSATTSDGTASTAMGSGTTASGDNSTAMGSGTKALGTSSTAMGANTTAVGTGTIALGSNAAAFGNGSFAFGDVSTTAVISALESQFVARASGGFRFRTSFDLSTGCDLPGGSGTFACTSSRLAKERFEEVDGDTVLAKLATLPIQRWSYRGLPTRHIGPVAEDFYAAFGLGEGPTTISTVDPDGISLLAVQALARRTAALQNENAALKGENTGLRAAIAAVETNEAGVRAELDALRAEVQRLAGERSHTQR